MALLEEYPPSGRILDLGCGTGDLAIALVRNGHSVLAVDFAPAAIEVAEARAGSLTEAHHRLLQLEVADALHPSVYEGQIGSIVDSGFFHLFDPPVRRELADELGLALPKGGRYYMLGFGVALPSAEAPRQVTSEEIEALFSRQRGWVIRGLRPAVYLTNGFGEIPALAVCVERS